MIANIKHWFDPPVFAGDEVKTEQARFLDRLILYNCAAIFGSALVVLPFYTGPIGVFFILLAMMLTGNSRLFSSRFNSASKKTRL